MPAAMTSADAAYIRPYGVGFSNAVRCELGARRGFGRGGGDGVVGVSCGGHILSNSWTLKTRLSGTVVCININIIQDFYGVLKRSVRAR